MNMKVFGLSAGMFLGLAGAALANGETRFMVRVENITKPDAFTASNGTKWSLAFSPGTAIVHTDKAPVFSEGQKHRGKGLEAQAEDGDPSGLAKSLKDAKGIKSVAVYNAPVGASGPGPITPGAAYETTIAAAPGDKLTMTLMMGQSNDWFYAPGEAGIELFKDGKPISGDISAQLMLWNAGTEIDEEPGIGANQGPRQKAANTGPAESGVVNKVKDGKLYTDAAKVLRVTIQPVK